MALLSKQIATDLLPKRPEEGHKNTFGRVLVVGGSRKLAGSVALVSEAVLSTGAGSVTLAAPECVIARSGLVLPEVMRWTLPDTREGTLSLASYKQLTKEDLEHFEAFAVGPGMTYKLDVRKFFDSLLKVFIDLKKPVVLDADALNCLSHKPVKLNDYFILTPHIGEAKRLLDIHEEIDHEKMADQLRQKYHAQIVLKSDKTLIAGNDGKIWQNTTGNSGLATAGSGDVLTGVIAALLAQGCTPLDAARLGVYLHGLAGDLAAEEFTEFGVRAGLVSEFLAPAFKTLV